jgi:hypothetical protein
MKNNAAINDDERNQDVRTNSADASSVPAAFGKSSTGHKDKN